MSIMADAWWRYRAARLRGHLVPFSRMLKLAWEEHRRERRHQELFEAQLKLEASLREAKLERLRAMDPMELSRQRSRLVDELELLSYTPVRINIAAKRLQLGAELDLIHQVLGEQG